MSATFVSIKQPQKGTYCTFKGGPQQHRTYRQISGKFKSRDKWITKALCLVKEHKAQR